jgi:hypothetical protein
VEDKVGDVEIERMIAADVARLQEARAARLADAFIRRPVPLVGGRRRQLGTSAAIEQALDDLERRIVVRRARILVHVEA